MDIYDTGGSGWVPNIGEPPEGYLEQDADKLVEVLNSGDDEVDAAFNAKVGQISGATTVDNLSDATAAGKAFLKAVDAAARQVAAGFGTAALQNSTAFAQSIHVHDASAITTGVFDPARLPPSSAITNVVPAGGTIASLTVPEQNLITQGCFVTISTGEIYAYKGVGSKTLVASYVLTGLTQIDWVNILNKPSTFTPSAHAAVHSAGGADPITINNLAGVTSIAKGGTGQTLAASALNALLPAQATNDGRVLGTDGINPFWVTQTGGVGGGGPPNYKSQGGNVSLAVALTEAVIGSANPAITGSGTSAVIRVTAYVSIQKGTGTTAITWTARIRRGTTTGGTLIATATITSAVASAGNPVVVQGFDALGATAGQYVVTIQGSAANGTVLFYAINAFELGGGGGVGGGAAALDDLTDVTITTPVNTQILQYNGTAWVNVAAPSGGVTDGDKGDVVITGGGTAWKVNILARGTAARDEEQRDRDRPTVFDWISDTPKATIQAGTNTNDLTTQTQAAIDACKAANCPLRIPFGLYYVTTLWITRTAFEGFELRGDGRGFAGGTGTNFALGQTRIKGTSLTSPVIAIQSARGVRIADILVDGPNNLPNGVVWDSIPEPENSSGMWLTSGVRDNRYSPQCGIAIDPTVGVDPGGGNGYPGLTYAGAPSQGSADITLDRVGLWNHNVGLMVCPTIDGQQGDQMAIYNPQIAHCHIGFASGLAQANQISMFGGSFYQARTAVDCLTYGQQQGIMPTLYNTQLNVLYRMFIASDAFKAAGWFGVLAESCKMMGTWGLGATSAKWPLLLSGLRFHTRDDWKLPPFIIENWGPVNMNGCNVQENNGNGFYALNVAGNGPLTRTEFAANLRDPTKPIVSQALDLTKPDKIESARFYDVSLTQQVVGESMTELNALPVRIVSPGRCRSWLRAANARYAFTNKHAANFVAVGAPVASVVLNTGAKTITFTVGATTDIQIGDILFWPMLAVAPSINENLVPALRITNIVSLTVTCAMLWDPALYNPTYIYTASGVFIAPYEMAPGVSVAGTTANASTSVTGVTPTTVFKNGDWITGAGLNANARVVSGGGTGTLVLNRQATAAATVRLSSGKLQVPTVTDAFP